MSWLRRRRRGHDPAPFEVLAGLGDGEAPGGWDAEDGWANPDPFSGAVEGDVDAGPGEGGGASGAGRGRRGGSRARRGGGRARRGGEPGPAAERPAAPPHSGRRVVAIVAIAAALVAGLVGDHLLGGASPVQAAATPAVAAVAPGGSLSSTWFCPALQSSAQSPALGRIIIANPTGHLLSGTVTITPTSGPPVVQKPVVQPYTRLTYRLEQLVSSTYAATTVSFDQPGGAVEQEVQGSLGQSIAACATRSSDHWFFASGHTDQNATELLSLYNPYPAPAIADVSFATETGPAIPEAFQGVVIPGGGFNVLDVGSRVRIRQAVATTVEVTSGRLVVDKLQLQSASPRGLTVVLGAVAPALTWYYAFGISGGGATEHFEIYNPGSTEAQVQVSPVLDQGSAEPFDLVVPPDDRISLQVDKQPRIPPGVQQSWVLESTNGVPVVAERVIESAAPANRAGVSDTTGTSLPAHAWVFAAGSAANGADEWLALCNAGPVAAKVTVTASGLGAATPLSAAPLTLPPGTRQTIDVGRSLAKGIVVLDVRSTVPIAAERAQFVVGGPGMSDGVGILEEP